MNYEEGAAPTTARPDNTTRPPQDLVTYSWRTNPINLSPAVPTALDVRIRDRYVRYVSDPRPGPLAGLWRTGGDGVPERISPLALIRIEIGRMGGVEIDLIHPRTGDRYPVEGSIDGVADQLHLAGLRLGCRTDRGRIYWCVVDVVAEARRHGGEV